jgi:hypothetical protein
MSMTLMVKALKTKVGNPLRKLVLLKLADNANDQGECWPSYQYIADQCEMSKRSVMLHINKLIEDGFLKKEHRLGGEKFNKSNLYTLMVGAGDSLGVVQEIHPPSAGDSLGGSAGDAPRTYHSLEPINKPIDQSKIERERLELSSFEFWWEVYPKKIAKKVVFKDWLKVIKKMDDQTVRDLTNHIANDINYRLELLAGGDSRAFGFDRLHPKTYLSQERYNDDI